MSPTGQYRIYRSATVDAEVVEREQDADEDDEQPHQELRGEADAWMIGRCRLHDQFSRTRPERSGTLSMARQTIPMPAPTISSGHDVW